MKKLALAAAVATASLGLAPAAHAAQSIVITGPSGTFGDDSVGCTGGATAPCSFTRTFQFFTPVGYNLASATISSAMTGDNTVANIDFTSVTLNGVEFSVVTTGMSEFRNLLNQALVQGANNTLFVSGTTGGDAAFAGTLSFAAAVPEPATWAMMMLGFGAVGYSMRRRRADTRIGYAV